MANTLLSDLREAEASGDKGEIEELRGYLDAFLTGDDSAALARVMRQIAAGEGATVREDEISENDRKYIGGLKRAGFILFKAEDGGPYTGMAYRGTEFWPEENTLVCVTGEGEELLCMYNNQN